MPLSLYIQLVQNSFYHNILTALFLHFKICTSEYFFLLFIFEPSISASLSTNSFVKIIIQNMISETLKKCWKVLGETNKRMIIKKIFWKILRNFDLCIFHGSLLGEANNFSALPPEYFDNIQVLLSSVESTNSQCSVSVPWIFITSSLCSHLCSCFNFNLRCLVFQFNNMILMHAIYMDSHLMSWGRFI